MKQHLVTPREGILVPDPSGNGYLPEKGKPVVLTSYWYQRQADGDVSITELADDTEAPPAPAPAAAADAATTSKKVAAK